MFQCCPGCTEPGGDQSVWRYMDLPKYIDLLVRRKLFFARVGLMEDKFEGRYTHRHRPSDDEVAKMIEHAQIHMPALVEGYSDHELQAIIEASRAASAKTVDLLRNFAFISCWHQNDYESAGMWGLYVKSTEGIAIRTTYDKLKRFLKPSVAGSLLLTGRVEYLDYDTDLIGHMDFFLPFMRKRRSFEHEREVRLACIDMQSIPNVADGRTVTPPRGVDFTADLVNLIEKIYVAPSSPNWFLKVIEDVTSKYGVSAEVCQSDLDRDPVK
jgi:hypothetical protein